MKKKNIKYSILIAESKIRFGVTLVELMVTILIAMLVMAGIGVAMIDSVKSFPLMKERAHGSVVTDAYVAKAAFDRFCRKASIKFSLPSIGHVASSATVLYYNDANSPGLDRYAAFSLNSGKPNELWVTYGQCSVAGGIMTPIGTPSTERLATTVDTSISNPLLFTADVADMVMVLRLNKGNQAMTVTSAAVRHNE